MRTRLRKWWPILKALLAIAILIAIGRQFAHALRIPERGLLPALRELWAGILHPGWLILAGCLYLLGMGFSAVYWYRLLLGLGQNPPFLGAVRAHFIGQMGKYLPGKAWALFLRSSEIQSSGVRMGIAIMTSFYDVLTTMSVGALIAALLFAVRIQDFSAALDWSDFGRLVPRETVLGSAIDPKVFVLLSLFLLLLIGIPILPPVFNWIVHRIALPFREADAAPVARIPWKMLVQGLILTTGCWLLMGASLWAALQAALRVPAPWSWQAWADYTAFVALAYVASFVIIVVPSGLGVREFLLLLLLIPEIRLQSDQANGDAESIAVLAVLLLRLVWTTAEVVFVSLAYWLPAERKSKKEKGEKETALAT